ncbi:High mobility group protein [uncultured virus]|nr:High mobility group protein [uncultured virus]
MDSSAADYFISLGDLFRGLKATPDAAKATSLLNWVNGGGLEGLAALRSSLAQYLVNSGAQGAIALPVIQAATIAAPKSAGRTKKVKVAGEPKAALSGYLFFSQAARPDIKARHPEYTFGEVGKALGEWWKALTPAQKAPYEQAAAQDKLRFQQELATFNRSRGV